MEIVVGVSLFDILLRRQRGRPPSRSSTTMSSGATQSVLGSNPFRLASRKRAVLVMRR